MFHSIIINELKIYIVLEEKSIYAPALTLEEELHGTQELCHRHERITP